MDWIERFFRNRKEGFDQLEVDEAMWQNIRHSLDQPLRPVSKAPNRHFWWAAAATVLLVLTLALFQTNKSSSQDVNPALGLDLQDTFPNITLRDPDGKPIPISSLKGKIVLVEFWASYSKVCTEEHCYFFKPIYNEFKDKGFEIYAVSVDSSAMDWIKAIQEEELDWVNVSDLQGEASPLASHFSIDELPMTFLLDGEGRVIAKDIQSSELKDKLDQLLAFNNNQ